MDKSVLHGGRLASIIGRNTIYGMGSNFAQFATQIINVPIEAERFDHAVRVMFSVPKDDLRKAASKVETGANTK